MQLISNKITVSADTPTITRERLLRTLHQNLTSFNSTVISGRAGTGKTLLVTDFANRCGRRVAWYKVDASDRDFRVFLNYLLASVCGEQRPGSAYDRPMNLAANSVENLTPIVNSFVYELLECGSHALLIIVEDLHLVYDAEWVVPFFRRLLPLLPADVHIIVTGRTMPPIPMWRMRSKQTLCLIEESALAFTLQEAQELFKSYGLSNAQAQEAFKQTRGRAALLDKVAQALSTSAEKDVAYLPHSRNTVAKA